MRALVDMPPAGLFFPVPFVAAMLRALSVAAS